VRARIPSETRQQEGRRRARVPLLTITRWYAPPAAGDDSNWQGESKKISLTTWPGANEKADGAKHPPPSRLEVREGDAPPAGSMMPGGEGGGKEKNNGRQGMD
jgi:hypothetical protein